MARSVSIRISTWLQSVSVSLKNVVDWERNVSSVMSARMRTLLGDASGDTMVNSGDATITRNRSGQTTGVATSAPIII